MKKLTEGEFADRVLAIQRAEGIFIETGLTDNISHAFSAYQRIFAEQERKVFLSTQVYGTRPRTPMDRFERPKCPDCEADMMFRNVPDNQDGIKVQLICSKCDTVLNDEHDLQWWMDNLKVKDGSESVPGGPETVQQDR